MTTPVVVSRIQNRRGTQAQLNGYAYSSAGPNSVYPNGYTGIGGYGSYPDFTAIKYPNILLPGEIALCTDSRRIFVGNLNGEYVELAVDAALTDIVLTPVIIDLPPVSTFTPIPSFPEFSATPFLSLLYSITDATLPSKANSVGNTFSKNGELKITSVVNFTPAPPGSLFPSVGPVSLSDNGTEINTSAYDISFIANYTTTGAIQISYMHNFPVTLTFSTSSIVWEPLL